MNDLEHDRQRALQALQQAFAVLRRHAEGPVPYTTKPGAGPVTAADHEVDALLRSSLPLPGDGWLSEESVDDERRLASRRVWVVDPLDGTRDFIAGRPEYSVSIALLVDGQPALGVVGNPANGVIVHGGPGLGLERIGPQPDPATSALRVLCSRSEWRRGEWQAVVSAGAVVQPLGSVAYKIALVAAGHADATWTLQPKSEWDVAAGAALVLAAGGQVWLPHARPLRWNRRWPRYPGFFACGPHQRERVRALAFGG